MQKIKKLVALLLLCTFFAFSSMPLTPFDRGDNQAAHAQTEKEPIILEFGSFDSDDISDLREGEGKIYKKITKALARLKKEDVIDQDAQPVIAIVRQKRGKLFD